MRFLAFFLFCIFGTVLNAQPIPEAQHLRYGLRASQLPGGGYLIAGANADFDVTNGCNIINTGFYKGTRGVLVINTGVSLRYGQEQLQLIMRTLPELQPSDVLALNLHPDYFFGNQAYSKGLLRATTVTQAGMIREGKVYEDNLYRLCGDWMKSTELTPPLQGQSAKEMDFLKDYGLKPIEMKGHTDSDLVLIDEANAVIWAGGLVFHQRIPTMPHAQLDVWIESLNRLLTLPARIVIPSHGPVSQGHEATEQTLDYLRWFDRHLSDAAKQGYDLNDVLRADVPERFRKWAAFPEEYYRNVLSLYPAYEKQVLERSR